MMMNSHQSWVREKLNNNNNNQSMRESERMRGIIWFKESFVSDAWYNANNNNNNNANSILEQIKFYIIHSSVVMKIMVNFDHIYCTDFFSAKKNHNEVTEIIFILIMTEWIIIEWILKSVYIERKKV